MLSGMRQFYFQRPHNFITETPLVNYSRERSTGGPSTSQRKSRCQKAETGEAGQVITLR